MKTKRTDVHRPSAINPEEYEFVAFEREKGIVLDIEIILINRAKIRAHMTRTGGDYSRHEHGGNCHICGASAIYTILWYHAPTNSYIRTGNDCAEKMDMSVGEDWNAFRASVHNALEAHAGKKKAAATLEAAGLAEAWTVYNLKCTCATEFVDAESQEWTRCTCAAGRKEERTIQDIVGRLVKYGSISEPAQKFIKTLLDRIANRAEIERQRAAEREAAEPCPTGRIKISGRILMLRVEDTDFGKTTKMLVQDDRGFKVWGSRPSFPTGPKTESYEGKNGEKIEYTQDTWANPERGDKVEFFAAVQPSDKDNKFGFYKRPTKAKVVEWVTEPK